MDVRDILTEWLTDHGFDGLYHDDCACDISDLMPCCGNPGLCEPGYKMRYPGGHCPCGGGCDWHISPRK